VRDDFAAGRDVPRLRRADAGGLRGDHVARVLHAGHGLQRGAALWLHDRCRSPPGGAGAGGPMSRIEAALASLGLTLPRPPTPIANFVPFRVLGAAVYLAGQVNEWNGTVPYVGK